ncbi:MAG: thioredoxin family protein [Acidobacteria bacterium]|nr:MAG: thioredoxin family protein [Acidobacteriota bacterium]
MFQRFGAQWTPTAIILDSEGKEQHRFEGFLPVDDFLAQLELGLAKLAFSHGQFKDAEKRFQSVVEQFPSSEAAPEALYWTGVSRYKDTGDGNALTETGRQFQSRYKDTSWAKKASVWVEQPAPK